MTVLSGRLNPSDSPQALDLQAFLDAAQIVQEVLEGKL